MPYIGNQAVVGDSANTFKLLDDISTFTLTFDGSSASVVSVANDTLTFANHRFITGQRVTYGKGGGTVITGLTDGTAYFIIKVNQSTIKLATNASNAASSTAIDLTGLGAGTSHTLNVAFDGVNTKFKATHTDGTKASVSRAAQLSLSINGVIQQPTEAKPPTVGYGIEADSTIVLSTAPVATDKVFGSFIGEVAPSFDLTDNTVNNFTGDGSTSTFNLSKEIPSNNDVLVTLDGVTQYPSDTSTTRAYSVVGSSLIFVSAPADGVAIQVRMIGFAGSTAAEVTGFYGRTGNVALKSTDDITFQNASAGIITASKFVGVSSMTDVFVSGITSFTNATDSTSSSTGSVIVSGGVGIAGSLNVGGSVSVGGTLTYEDVTNIDSVGIITARSNILVGSGITLSPDGDVFATGISTFSEGFAGDVLIDDKIVHRGDLNTAIRFPADDTFSVETNGDEAFRINSGQKMLIGSTAQRDVGSSAQSVVAIEGVSQNRSSISLIHNSNTAVSGSLRLGKTRGANVGGTTVVQSADNLGQIRFAGSDGTDMTNITALIGAQVNGTVASDTIPTDLVFETSATSGSSRAERLRITSDGNIYTSGDQVRDDAKLTIQTNRIGISTSIHLHNGNASGTATKISASKSIILSADFNANSGTNSSYISFETNATEKMLIESDGTVTLSGGRINLTKQGASNIIKVGSGQNANNYAYIDFIGDDTHTDYGLRLLRGNTGANAISQLNHRGTGNLQIKTSDAAPIQFMTGGGNERLRIDSSGRLLLGTDTARAVGGESNPVLHIEGAGNTSNSWINLTRFQAGTGSANLQFAKSRSNTPGTYTVVQDDDKLGQISFLGSDGTDMANYAAKIESFVDGTPGSNDMPGRLVFSTTADGSGSPTERLRITSNGQLLIGGHGSPHNAGYKIDIQADTTTHYNGLSVRATALQNDSFCVAALAHSTPSGSSTNRRAHIGVYRNGSSQPGGYIYMHQQDGGNTYIWPDSSAVLRISNAVGNVTNDAGSVVGAQTSDIRLKNVHGDVAYGLAEINKITPIEFNFKNDKNVQKRIGFSAQDLQSIIPESVYNTKNTEEVNGVEIEDVLGMEYAQITPVLVNAVKELSTEIDKLKAEIAALKSS